MVDEWCILLAKYGLVHPYQVIEPYNVTLKTAAKSASQTWAEEVFIALKPHLQPGDTVMFLAGKIYRELLLNKVSCFGYKVEIPLEGLRTGEQML